MDSAYILIHLIYFFPATVSDFKYYYPTVFLSMNHVYHVRSCKSVVIYHSLFLIL